MGNTWEVYAWREVNLLVRYDYVLIYAGESFLMALWMVIKEKRVSGCVKVEWR